METLIIVVLTVIVALAFDLINGFHDSANSIATVVSTRVLSPRIAVYWAAFFNFVAMFIFAPRVANTIAKIIDINSADTAFVYVVLAGLLGAIVWDLITWYWGLPTSSSHALIGGLVGAGVAHSGFNVVHWETVMITVGFIPIAPLMGMVIGFFFMVAVFWIFRRKSPLAVDRFFRVGQLFSAAMYSLGHGGNDAQKTMGTIVVVLVAAGYFKPDTQLSLLDWHTAWIILSCQTAMALGTAFGGWRIVKTMGMKITKLKPVGGFCAETAGAATLFIATHMGIPVSTTHTITGAIVGVGSTTKFSTIKWGIARSIVWAWIMTIPLSALVAAVCFWLIQAAHPGF
ncbi:MAG: inorganic phosphate transporter [FCB group bacterium]|jgi:PiT family inorganic phosphate transporter|nr:inorganic phosphate transporter [FCB group bacterium]